jgi:hypothetical protein
MGMKSLIIAGSLAQRQFQGGLAWFYLQYILGFRRLGWEVLFIDRLEPEMCVNETGRNAPFEGSLNLSFFLGVMDAFGLSGSFSLIYNKGDRVVGQPRKKVLLSVTEAPLLLNVMGFLDDEEILARAQRRVFVDIDPGYGQMWRELGWHDAFRGHDAFVTLGRNIGRGDCAIPTCGLNWVTMSQPVVLEQWPISLVPGVGQSFTSIGAWRGPNGPIEYQGKTYGLRAHEFRKFATLPRMCRDESFEMALDIHTSEVKDLEMLRDNGWRLVEPKAVAGTPQAYRSYIAGSMAEFMVPKNMYVQSNSGLLSDRSVYYLASGRPVLARDTGIKHLYPTGEGLLTFATLDEAVDGVRRITADYTRHAAAARRLAVEFFDSDRVLCQLLDDLNIDGPRGTAECRSP